MVAPSRDQECVENDVVCPVTANLGKSISAWGTSAPMHVVLNVVDSTGSTRRSPNPRRRACR